jgi:hypothetical protein
MAGINPVKKDALFYLIFHSNLDKITAKLPAVMLAKMQESNIYYGRKFHPYFGCNHCSPWIFCTQESTPAHYEAGVVVVNSEVVRLAPGRYLLKAETVAFLCSIETDEGTRLSLIFFLKTKRGRFLTWVCPQEVILTLGSSWPPPPKGSTLYVRGKVHPFVHPQGWELFYVSKNGWANRGSSSLRGNFTLGDRAHPWGPTLLFTRRFSCKFWSRRIGLVFKQKNY